MSSTQREGAVGCRLVVSDPKEGQAKGVVLTAAQLQAFIGKKVGDVVDGSVAGLRGTKLKITGGTDADGFPIRPDVSGARKAKILLSGGPGFQPRRKPSSKRKKKRNTRLVRGMRKRVTVRGNTITERIAQINTVTVEASPAERS